MGSRERVGKLRHFLSAKSNFGAEMVRTGSCFLLAVWRQQGAVEPEAESNPASTISQQREDRMEPGFRVTQLYHGDNEHLTGPLPRLG